MNITQKFKHLIMHGKIMNASFDALVIGGGIAGGEAALN